MLRNNKDNTLLKNNVLKFLFLELFCIALMTLDHSSKIATPIRAALSTLTYPLVKAIEWPQNAYKIIKLSISDQTSLIDENTVLKAKVSQAQIDLLQLEVLQQQNKELRELLETKEQLPLVTTSAFVSNINTGNNEHIVVIDQGFNQGIYEGQPVLDLNGVAGQVFRVELENSHVLLISDKTHAIPVEILRTGYRTIAYGSGDINFIDMPEMDQAADIQINDIVITSGYGDLFPRGLRLGVISQFGQTPDRFFLKARASLTADLKELKQVLLVWSESTKPSNT